MFEWAPCVVGLGLRWWLLRVTRGIMRMQTCRGVDKKAPPPPQPIMAMMTTTGQLQPVHRQFFELESTELAGRSVV